MSEETTTPASTETTPAPEPVEAPTPATNQSPQAPETAPAPVTPQTTSEASQEAHKQSQEEQETKPGINTLDDALKVISDLRKENARARTTAKETAANEARMELAQKVATALGVTTAENEPPQDPAEQVKALTTQVAENRERAEQATRELAVYRSAQKAGANPDALLDSRSFMNTLSTIDATDPDEVTKAIKTAVTNNPTLKANQAFGPNRIDHTPGGAGHAEPKSLEEAIQARYQ